MGNSLNSQQLVRFDVNGTAIGTGFALSNRYILTCTHVVKEICESVGLPGQTFQVVLPKLAPPKTVKVKVLIAVPQTDNPQNGKPEDITVLEVCDEHAHELTFNPSPIKLLGSDDHRNHRFFAQGYFMDEGSSLRGTFDGLSDNGWIEFSQFDLPNGVLSLGGLSGAPVWNEDVSAITGIVVAEREGINKAFMIPLVDVLKIWPEFEQYLPSTVGELLFPEQTESEFLAQIKDNISKELKRPEIKIFAELISRELTQWLKHDANQKLVEDTGKITDALVKALEQGGDDVPVINNILAGAVHHCFHADGSHYNESKVQHDKIEEVLESILGWLVLASLEKTIVANIKPKPNILPAVYIEIPIQTAAGVETIVSYQFRRAAVWEVKNNDISGKHMLKVDFNVLNWQESEIVSTLKLQLWNKVFDENKETPLKAHEVKRLNARLKNSRETKLAPAHYYFAVQCENSLNNDFFQNAYQTLLTDLSNLTFVRFGWEDGENYFCAYEHNLMDAINLLINSLRKMRKP